MNVARQTANCLIVGIVAAFLAFLPPACERLLGAPLAMPSVATWWCGEARALDEASQDLGAMVIKPVFPDAPMEPVFLASNHEASSTAARLSAACRALFLTDCVGHIS